jgi:hypothetical protein
MKTCKDCKWWIGFAFHNDGKCGNDRVNDDGRASAYGDRQLGLLITGPDFGCVHWTAKNVRKAKRKVRADKTCEPNAIASRILKGEPLLDSQKAWLTKVLKAPIAFAPST